MTSGADGTRTRGETAIQHENSPMVAGEGSADQRDREAKSATEVDAIETRDRVIETPTTEAAAPDAVELALAAAVSRAAAEGRREVLLPQLVIELEARRKARQARGVIDFQAERTRRR